MVLALKKIQAKATKAKQIITLNIFITKKSYFTGIILFFKSPIT